MAQQPNKAFQAALGLTRMRALAFAVLMLVVACTQPDQGSISAVTVRDAKADQHNIIKTLSGNELAAFTES